jgi:hypothetical protein
MDLEEKWMILNLPTIKVTRLNHQIIKKGTLQFQLYRIILNPAIFLVLDKLKQLQTQLEKVQRKFSRYKEISYPGFR